MRFRLSRAPGTAAILAAITVVFAFEWMTGALWNDDKLVQMGAIIPGLLQRHEYWRVVTAMFLHGNVLHWAANCWALYQLGMLFEVMFGSLRFLVTYFVTGICASVASSMFTHGASVGASGAILGILGAFIFSIRRSPQWRHEPWTRSLIAQLMFWGVLNIILGFSVAYIDNVAHIAGLVSGLLLGFIPHRVPPPPPGRSVIDVRPYEDAELPSSENEP
ncbi:MAG TPA: rhomboid family intramembrane serine protease [Thermoanaerobaculia bacterium]|nr:rhomboid family intramembrane serine protease [Thermoanaerobaculia bacterium]